MVIIKKNTRVEGRFWFNHDDRHFVAEGKIELLELINELGSISKAAKVLGMSYKAAWDMVKNLNDFSSCKMVRKNKGGKGGGGTVVTEKGFELIRLYREAKEEHDRFMKKLTDKINRELK